MKTRVLSSILLMGVVSASMSGHAFSLNPFKKKNTSASDQMVAETPRKGKFMRGMRYIGQRVTYSCDSSNAGRLDGFRRCLQSSIGKSMDIDKRSTVVALDNTGVPLKKNISRVHFKQDWFRRQMVMSSLTQNLLSTMLKLNQQLAEVEQEQSEQEAQGDNQAEAMEDQVQILKDDIQSYQDQFESLWIQYGILQEEMGQSATATEETKEFPMTAVPMPEASDSVFSPVTPITGSPIMSAAFSASLDKFAHKNPNVMRNFCYNFFAVGDTAGYEENYVRLGEKGSISPTNVAKYQNAKQSIIAGKCSQNSMVGLLWRKLYSLCPLEQGAETIAACTGFDDGTEVAASQYKGS